MQGTNGGWYPQGCSDGWTGNCKCSKTTTDFNPKTCSDGFQNCDESCKDGGDKGNIMGSCIRGAETDNTYTVSFEFSQPAELSGTNFYSDANS